MYTKGNTTEHFVQLELVPENVRSRRKLEQNIQISYILALNLYSDCLKPSVMCLN